MMMNKSRDTAQAGNMDFDRGFSWGKEVRP